MSATTPRWSRKDPDARREEILDAARRLFAEQPYGGVSITSVAERAGVSRALVTHYFGGKRELYLTILRDAIRVVDIVPDDDPDLPLEARVARNVDRWLTIMADNREVVFAVTETTTIGGDQAVALIVDELRDAVVERIVVSHFDVVDVPSAVHVALRAYTGMAQVAIADWLGRGGISRPQVAALLVQNMLSLVRDVLPRVLEQPAADEGDADAAVAGAGAARH